MSFFGEKIIFPSTPVPGINNDQSLISCTKFGINQTILTVFSGVRAKKPPPGNRVKTIMKLNFESGVQFDENLMGCEMGQIKVVMNKPVYLGQVILDLSKVVKYEFHYDYMK